MLALLFSSPALQPFEADVDEALFFEVGSFWKSAWCLQGPYMSSERTPLTFCHLVVVTRKLQSMTSR